MERTGSVEGSQGVYRWPGELHSVRKSWRGPVSVIENQGGLKKAREYQKMLGCIGESKGGMEITKMDYKMASLTFMMHNVYF